ncbi:hypothetical protein [Gallibacterium salpingitidis]|uniref:hypothetical protein n=1 Tax=Gallibacterium salpingitidis TaxID=505341 RepID=UPI000829544F|nr:hypothetical protein [Gallibacterium salpingitidis]
MKQFDLEKALAGEPIKLQDGYKAYIVHKLENNEIILLGYYIDDDGMKIPAWWNDDGSYEDKFEDNLDIIGMWEDHELPILSIEGNQEYKEVLYFNKRLFVPAWTKVIAADQDGQIVAYSNDQLLANRNIGAWEQLESGSDDKFEYIGLCQFGYLYWYNSMVTLP